MRDWRVEKLRAIMAEDRRLGPSPDQHAFALTHDLIGYRVVRPGVPNFNARESWHLTRRAAERAITRWNRAIALDETLKPTEEGGT